MTNSPQTDGIVAGRLDDATLAAHFDDLYPILDDHEARVAADRCYFCHDAPCITACPTAIDIPLFIRQIQTGQPDGAARTILSQNILGAMCARVCPTETLCEGACVRNEAEGNPVEIGRLQRYATDGLLLANEHPFARAPETGKTVAVIGAGPAGLSAAHRLAMLGHAVTLYDTRTKAGGLNEYGIAAYKAANGIAQAEVDWLLRIGGITVKTGQALGAGLTLDGLKATHDAVFLGIGLAGVNALNVPGEDLPAVQDAVDFIETLRQTGDKASLPIGRHVVVIGGGMTAVDAAVQSRLLGAEHVSIVYRRDRGAMSASDYELDHAATEGVSILTNAMPVAISAAGVTFAYTRSGPNGLEKTGETFTLKADQVFKAIGQTLKGQPDALKTQGGKIVIDAAGRTSVTGVWAGGDCATGGEDLTVTAVAQGRDAALDIHRALCP
ncbi:NAD(P)-dependent oxidoreductase [Pararhodobacter aggregans]|uniref:Dihydropyrimidine dehydrogenase n=1 Tax=Pararhodobacter aggregans TaxID=404875 RepID=A0A2T7UR19_9RHOB|nr:NAD(P)-dependent oxidoreductase [Pararhodobacter aggregans]PTX02022.1 glutamate synthase (NADPH/NADH) small chain [Pararhodobacter aggregans]PVE47200.1 dihydropyrimidine dehydrogenase [Pararhodobacter aggregans]